MGRGRINPDYFIGAKLGVVAWGRFVKIGVAIINSASLVESIEDGSPGIV